MRPMNAIGCVLLSTLALGCIPTLSQPRGEAHLASMEAASRHHHHGRIEQAAQAWDEAARTAERRVDREEAEYRRARALLRLERDHEALEVLDAISARRPIARRTIRALFDAARIRLGLGETERAHDALTFIVNERPGDGPASRALRLLMQARASEPAASRLAFLRALYEKVGASDLGDDLLTFEAEIHLERGDRAASVATYERLLREHPYPHGQRWDETLERLADLAEEDGDYAGAVAYLTRMVQVQESTVTPGSQTLPGMPAARLRIARIYRDHLHDPERAASHFARTYEQFPTSRLGDDALYELGAMWLDADQRERGCAMLARVVREFEVGHARRRAARRIEAECER